MKKFTISLILALSLCMPFVSSAQNTVCVTLTNNLHYSSRDTYTNGEVSVLQGFLHEQNYLSVAPTGYFGLLTLKAAKDFQRASSIISTGYVGPITRAKIKALTCGTNQTSSPITVISPNGGEMWGKGETHTIKWQDNRRLLATYDINLLSYFPPCTKGNSGPCPLSDMPYPAPRNIATGVSGTSYSWTLPTANSAAIPSGSYLIQVCQTNQETCDRSDDYFSITSTYTLDSGTTTKISSISPTSGPIGTSVTINGTGFTSTNNVVRFNNGYEGDFLSSSDGTTLRFAVPDGLSSCPPDGLCGAYMPLAPGTYDITVSNTKGTSNSVNFTVTTGN